MTFTLMATQSVARKMTMETKYRDGHEQQPRSVLSAFCRCADGEKEEQGSPLYHTSFAEEIKTHKARDIFICRPSFKQNNVGHFPRPETSPPGPQRVIRCMTTVNG